MSSPITFWSITKCGGMAHISSAMSGLFGYSAVAIKLAIKFSTNSLSNL